MPGAEEFERPHLVSIVDEVAASESSSIDLLGGLRGEGTHQSLRIVIDVDQAADGKEAVEACKENEYGLVLMDWNMPNMLGIDAVKEIRALGCTTPIIMVTTEAEKSRVVEALKAGANNYIIKPFEPTTIVDKIKAVLEKHGSSMDNVVKATVFLADIDEWGAMNDVYVTFFPKNKPARSAVETPGLALKARVEIECIAYIPEIKK